MIQKTAETMKSSEQFPEFDRGADGYPIPGKVVKYYREHKTYIDRDGKERHWTQADLATRLGLKEIMVNLMENKNQGLDSIERRRALASILRIPPVLLGLDSLDQIVEIVSGPGQTLPSTQTHARRSKVGNETIKLYQDTFKVYESLFSAGLTYTNIHDIDKWTEKIARDASNVDTAHRKTLLRILWDFETLCAKVYSSDACNWSKTFEHVDSAIEIATLLGDRDLQAASLYHSGQYHWRQGRLGLARVDMDGALLYARGALPQTKGAVYSGDAFLRAQSSTISEITIAQEMLSNAEKYAGIKSEMKTIKFGKGTYFIGRAGTFLDIGRPAKALEFIDDAERHINPARKRLLVYLDIMRSRCYIEQKKPEYEMAIDLLAGAIEDSKELKIQRHIDHIDNLYVKLVQSPYGNAPDVADLGQALRRLQVCR